MTTPAYRRTANIRLTWQRVIGDSLSVTTVGLDAAPVVLTVPVYHENPFGDPDRMAAPKTPPDRAWVETAWLDERAGRRGFSRIQVDVHVRIGPKGSAAQDAFGIMVDDVADAVEDLFSGVRPDGTYKGWIPVLDFANPNAPVPAGECIFVQDPFNDSSWGQPEERKRLPTYEGVQRISIRYALRLVTDAVAGLAPWH